jgi:hypothetical protein
MLVVTAAFACECDTSEEITQIEDVMSSPATVRVASAVIAFDSVIGAVDSTSRDLLVLCDLGRTTCVRESPVKPLQQGDALIGLADAMLVYHRDEGRIRAYNRDLTLLKTVVLPFAAPAIAAVALGPRGVALMRSLPATEIVWTQDILSASEVIWETTLARAVLRGLELQLAHHGDFWSGGPKGIRVAWPQQEYAVYEVDLTQGGWMQLVRREIGRPRRTRRQLDSIGSWLDSASVSLGRRVDIPIDVYAPHFRDHYLGDC